MCVKSCAVKPFKNQRSNLSPGQRVRNVSIASLKPPRLFIDVIPSEGEGQGLDKQNEQAGCQTAPRVKGSASGAESCEFKPLKRLLSCPDSSEGMKTCHMCLVL